MKAWKSYVLAVSMLFFGGICTAHGGDIGELDTTFGDQGKVVTVFGEFGDQAYAVAMQPDGKILAAGSTFNGYDYDLAIARYNEDGSLDTSFNTDGKVRTSLGDGDEEITAIAVQDDGYIVVAGYTVVDGGRDFVLVRFTPDGEFDNSFGEGGKVITAFGNQDDEITAMTLDDEGRIVVCGYVTGTAGTIVTLGRYLTSGLPDITFGDQGAVLMDIGDDALARSVDIDAEGRIILAGSSYQAKRTELMVLRFLASGKLDAGFGRQGIAVPADQETSSDGYGVRLLEDGRIMVAGTVGDKGDRDAALYRFTASGQPDGSFGINGLLVTSAGDEDDMALAIDVLDNVVGLSGYSTFNTKRDFLFVSVEQATNDGANVALNKDTSGFPSTGNVYGSIFDVNGKPVESISAGDTAVATEKSVFNTTRFGYTDDLSYAVVLQADGKAVSVGFSVQDEVSRFAVARYITPVANAAGGGVSAGVNWILTKEPTNVNRTGAFTGGTIMAPAGTTITQRGVVYSIAPDPVYKKGSDVPPSDPGTTPGSTASPVITITSPGAGGDTVNQGKTYSITYNLTDADSTSLNVKFYYSLDQVFNSGDDLLACPAPSVAPGTGLTCGWTPDVNAVGKVYYIYGEASDTVNTGTNWSPGTVTVNDALGASIVSAQSLQAGSVTNLFPPAVTSSVNTSISQPVSSSENESADTQLVVFNGSPSGEIAAGTSMTYIGVYTSDKSTCRFSALSDQDFVFMPEAMATADNLAHIAKVTGLRDDHDYSYYVRCRDLAGSRDTSDYEVSFRVASAQDYEMQPYRRLTSTLGGFFVATANAESTPAVDPATPPADNNPTSVFDLSSPTYADEGSTSDGAGNGSYSSILKGLRPGTFYYVRAYALDGNGKVYYGNQVGIKTADACFIATAAYGTILHPYVKVLRGFRDRYMITNMLGNKLVNLYYHYSPPVADYIAVRPVVRGAVRVALLPVIGMGWLILNIGFAGLALMALVLIMPFMLVYRSYRRLDIYGKK